MHSFLITITNVLENIPKYCNVVVVDADDPENVVEEEKQSEDQKVNDVSMGMDGVENVNVNENRNHTAHEGAGGSRDEDVNERTDFAGSENAEGCEKKAGKLPTLTQTQP